MARINRPPARLLVTSVLLGASSVAQAQVDVNPPRPNVLLLVDSSGSMEYMTASNAYPSCNASATERSRWIDLVEVLTGTIPNYHCAKIARNTADFMSVYHVPNANAQAGLNPPDYLYPIPYHLPMSGTCAPSPTSDWGAIGFCNVSGNKPCKYDDSTKCAFPKTEGGLLNAFVTEIRFGLMTFDSSPNPSTGIDGTWSYVVGSSAKGAPMNCTRVADQEVGARNATAPIWEGRMVTFGPAITNNEIENLRTKNETIQKVLLSTRPYGATPIAGMLRDAQDFFWNDPDPDGTDPNGTLKVAPKLDPYTNEGCRDNFIVLLTDGEPNMDLRPFCEGYNSVCGAGQDACCPFNKPEDIARALANDQTRPKVKTFVIGFAVTEIKDNQGTLLDCAALTEQQVTAPGGVCSNPQTKGLQTCCRLHGIAYNGGTSTAYFANTVESLRSSLSEVLSKASKGTTSRTIPVFASAATTTAGSSTFRFYTSFTPKIDGSGLWQGVIDRQRYVCEGGAAPNPKTLDKDKGDDFVHNVNASPTPARRFYTFLAGAPSDSAVHSTRTVRRQLPESPGDGLGTYTGYSSTGSVTGFTPEVTPAAMDIAATPCMSESTQTATKCRDRYLKWLIGGDNGTTYHRCKTLGDKRCNLIGDIYHSTPAVVGKPSESLRDEGYQLFSRGRARLRPIVLYTSTNDGLLHAFKVATNNPEVDKTADTQVLSKTNNELWAFIPPAVLPRIPSEYPNVHMLLLDGAPLVRDVVGTKPTGSATIRLERDMATTSVDSADWRTVLVQSFGGAYSGYFALDVTDPEVTDAASGPKFLWQLTTDAAGNQLFGEGGSTPTIATLYFDPKGGDNPREIPVAILPGGTGGTPAPQLDTCKRYDLPAVRAFSDDIRPREDVPCYDADPSASNRAAAQRARSLTIVRLDNGEVIRTFRRNAGDAPSSISSRVIKEAQAPLDSPITGQPVAYPGWTGAIADRAYVGDADGTLWRVDLSSYNPANWTMKLFFDAYHVATGTTATQPIATTPIVSTSEDGNVVVLFSTGNQEDLVGSTQTDNFVYSIREVITYSNTTSVVVPKVNWYKKFTAGNRVAGPMTLFSSAVYFSTYAPPTTSYGCDSGSSSLWGMHFVTPEDSSALSKGGLRALPAGGSATATTRVQELKADGNPIAVGSTIFGVGVGQLQGCYQTTTVTDPYFGTSYGRIDSGTAGRYQLVVQTGKAGSSAAQGSTNYATIDLPQPDVSPRISAWALVME